MTVQDRIDELMKIPDKSQLIGGFQITADEVRETCQGDGIYISQVSMEVFMSHMDKSTTFSEVFDEFLNSDWNKVVG